MGKITGWTKIPVSEGFAWEAEDVYSLDYEAVIVYVVPDKKGWISYGRSIDGNLINISSITNKETARKRAVSYMRRHPNG